MVEGIKLQNVETRSVLTLDMVSTQDFILNSVDWGTVESTHHSYKYVNQIVVIRLACDRCAPCTLI